MNRAKPQYKQITLLLNYTYILSKLIEKIFDVR